MAENVFQKKFAFAVVTVLLYSLYLLTPVTIYSNAYYSGYIFL